MDEVAAGVDERHHVPEGYDADVLMRWGDPVLPGAPPFDPAPPSGPCNTERPALQRLLEDVRAGKVDVIVVSKSIG